MEPMKSFTWWHAMDFHSVRPSSVYVVGRLGLSLESGWAYLQQTFFFVFLGSKVNFGALRARAGCFAESNFNGKLQSQIQCQASPCVCSLLVSNLLRAIYLSLSRPPRIVLNLNIPLSP